MTQTCSSPDSISFDVLAEIQSLLEASAPMEHSGRNEIFERLVAFLASARGKLGEVMHEENVSCSDLSRRLGKNRSLVTRFFRSEGDWKGSTLFHIAEALNCEIAIQIERKNSDSNLKTPLGNIVEIRYEMAST